MKSIFVAAFLAAIPASIIMVHDAKAADFYTCDSMVVHTDASGRQTHGDVVAHSANIIVQNGKLDFLLYNGTNTSSESMPVSTGGNGIPAGSVHATVNGVQYDFSPDVDGRPMLLVQANDDLRNELVVVCSKLN